MKDIHLPHPKPRLSEDVIDELAEQILRRVRDELAKAAKRERRIRRLCSIDPAGCYTDDDCLVAIGRVLSDAEVDELYEAKIAAEK